MTARAFLLILALCWPLSAFGTTTESLDIRAVQTDSTDVFQVLTTLNDATQALAERDYDRARRGFETALMHDPDLEAAKVGLRRSLMALGDIQAAAKWVKDPNSVDGLIIRVLQNEFEDPEMTLKLVLGDQGDPRLWTLLGRLQDSSKNHNDARQSYTKAGLSGARAGLADNNIGQSYLLEGQTALALKAFTAATLADPLDMQFDNNRRRALVASNQTHLAVKGLHASRAGVFLEHAGDHAVSAGDIKFAAFLYQKSLNIAPRYNPLVAKKLGQIRHQEFKD